VARRKQRELWAAPPPRGSLHYQHLFCRTHFIPPSTFSTSVVATAEPAASTPRGPPSTSPTSVVAAAGPAASNPQGARHRCLQLRWWSLSDLPPATPRGSAIDVSNFGGGRCRTCRQHPPRGPPSMSPTPVVAAVGPAASNPQGGRHRCLQLRWWPLPDLPSATPRGPAIDVSNSGGGCCRTFRLHPLGVHHRCFAKLGTCRQNFSSDTYQGATAVNITTTSKQLGGKIEASVSAKKIRVLTVLRTRES
jgi:hypothetical protein